MSSQYTIRVPAQFKVDETNATEKTCDQNARQTLYVTEQLPFGQERSEDSVPVDDVNDEQQ